MCSFNGAGYVEAQLDSILSQTLAVDEILIIDDGSQDQTIAILQKKAGLHPQIRIIQNESRLGATKNFEKGFLLAKNEWIAISDQDDLWHPQKIEKLVKEIDQNSLLIYCDSQRFRNNPDFSVRPKSNYQRFSGHDARRIFMFNTVSGHAILFNKKLLDLVLPLSKELFYDWVMAVTAAYNGGVIYVAETLVLQRIHSANLSTGEESHYASPVNRRKFKEMVLHHLHRFSHTTNMPDSHRQMAVKMLRLWKESLEKGFSLSLFLFLMKDRKQLFSFKKKKSLFFRHLKYSWWFCRN